MSNLTILLGYMALLVVLGAIISLKTTTPSGFMLGSRSFPGWLLSFSIVGTTISSLAFLAYPARGYSLDFSVVVGVCLSVFVGLFSAALFFVRFLRRTPDASIYTLLEERYGAWASIFASVTFIISSLFRMGVIMCLVAKAMHMISGSNAGGVILLCGIIVIFYTYMAGIEGVIWTDFIQTMVLIISGVVCLFFLADLLPDGFLSIAQLFPGSGEVAVPRPAGTPLWITCIYFITSECCFYMTNQAIAQRYLAGHSVRAAKNGTYLAALIAPLIVALFFAIGLALYVLYQKSGVFVLPPEVAADPDKVFIYFITQSIPDGLKGLIIVGILSAAMSTVDSGINSSATVFISNLYHPHIKRGRGESAPSMNILRRSSLLFGVIGIAIAYFVFVSGEHVLDVYWKWVPVISTGIFGLFVLMRVSKRVGALAGAVAIVFGSLVTAWVSFTGGKDIPYAAPFHYMLNYPVGILVMLVVGLSLGAVFKRKESKAVLRNKVDYDEVTGEEYVDRPVNTEYHLVKQNALIRALQPNPYYRMLGGLGVAFYASVLLGFFSIELLKPDVVCAWIALCASALLALTPQPRGDAQNKGHSVFVLVLLGVALPLVGAIGFFAHPGEACFSYFFMATIALLGAFVEWVVLGFLVSVAACMATLIVSSVYVTIGVPSNWLGLTSGCLGIMTLYAMSSARRSLRERERLEGVSMLSHVMLSNGGEEAAPVNRLVAETTDFLERGGVNEAVHVIESLSIHQCLLEALRIYPFQDAESAAVRLEIEQDFIIKGSRKLLVNVFLHLIDNSVYYLRAGSADVLVCQVSGQKREVCFEDNGPGVPSRNIPYIFELFFSAGKLGTGMGLTYCRKVLKLMKGSIHLTSTQEDSKTRFAITFSDAP